jgi:hypothetical protein
VDNGTLSQVTSGTQGLPLNHIISYIVKLRNHLSGLNVFITNTECVKINIPLKVVSLCMTKIRHFNELLCIMNTQDIPTK